MQDHSSWRELQTFAQCEPSALAFRALAALLETWSGADQAAALEHAGRLLASWPDEMRLAPWSWCKAVCRGDVPPAWPLVRALQLTATHLTKGDLDLARLAQQAPLGHITALTLPSWSDFAELSLLHHRPELFPALKTLCAVDKQDDGRIQALASSPLWSALEGFEIEALTDSLFHPKDASRLVLPEGPPTALRHLRLRAFDLMAAWDAQRLPHLKSAEVFILSLEEAQALAARPELAGLRSLSIAFRCAFNGSSPFQPFLGNEIEADQAAAEAFFRHARLELLEKLALIGHRAGYWGREGMGPDGLGALLASGLLQRIKHLRLELLPLGDRGVAMLAPALGRQLQTLELVDVYCKDAGAAALIESPCLSSLQRLDLSGNRIGAESLIRMAQVPMPALRSLDLSGPSIHPYYWSIGQQPVLSEGAAAWAASPNAAGLTALRLANCYLTDGALIAVFQSDRMKYLTQLDLSHNTFTAAAIEGAVVDSPLWQGLRELALSDCRLDNAALQQLVRVPQAPALRSLRLAYNSIGPAGAAALAGWPVLSQVWELDLHDNFIGDEGLIALARSPHLGRLLELDLEQDVWNTRRFDFSDRAAHALAQAPGLGRLEGLFSGCVDEYHSTAYSPGFSKEGLRTLMAASGRRPAFQACCADFTGVSEYAELPPLREDTPLDSHDFRSGPLVLNTEEATSKEHPMQQVSYPGSQSGQAAPLIRATLPEPAREEPDILAGIEYEDPELWGGSVVEFELVLKEPRRPLPDPAVRWIETTLDSWFRAASLGTFSSQVRTLGQDGEGNSIVERQGFKLSCKAEPRLLLEGVREVLWWVGASELGEKGFPLPLTEPPEQAAGRLLQLAVPTVARLRMKRRYAYRIDRVPFSSEQREGILRVLAATPTAEGRLEVVTQDGGRLWVFVRYLASKPAFDSLNILCEQLTRQSATVIHRLMQECGLMLLPMAWAATDELARGFDCEWPRVEVLESAEVLHDRLARGPYHWWSTRKL